MCFIFLVYKAKIKGDIVESVFFVFNGVVMGCIWRRVFLFGYFFGIVGLFFVFYCFGWLGRVEEGIFLVVYWFGLFVCGFFMELVKWKGKVIFCSVKVLVFNLGVFILYCGILFCFGIKRSISKDYRV